MNIKIKDLSYKYNELEVFNDLNLSISSGKVTAVLGPSGCGKTTLLNLISGLSEPLTGSLDKPENSLISYIFQEPRLLPWYNIQQNIMFVLNGIPEEEKSAKVNHLLNELGLMEYKTFFPSQLSGGMNQRVSIARAFAFQSNTILMDEPFKGLDLPLKLNLFKLFNNLWREDKRTAIFVTHNIQEALILGDEIIVLSKRPSNLIKKISNPTSYLERTLLNPSIISLEKELYTLIM